MILFLSYWPNAAINGGRDLIDHQFIKNLWVMALSCLYCKQLGVTLIMHTNDFGYQFLKEFPYSDVLTTLNKISTDMSKRFFACSKFYAQQEMPLGAIHIDNDVFIKNKKCLEALNFDDSDLIVELKEYIDNDRNPIYNTTSNVLIEQFPKVLIDYNVKGTYRCGIVGINNLQLKDEYCTSYLKSVLILSLQSELLLKNKFIVPDLILELSNLFNISEYYKTKILLPDYFPQFDHYPYYQAYAVNIGYLHVLGCVKWEDKTLDAIKLTIYKYDQKFYKIIENLINKYLYGLCINI